MKEGCTAPTLFLVCDMGKGGKLLVLTDCVVLSWGEG